MSRHPSDTMSMALAIIGSSGLLRLGALGALTQQFSSDEHASFAGKQRHPRVVATTSDTRRAKLIEQQAWNEAVDHRKADKRAQKMKDNK